MIKYPLGMTPHLPPDDHGILAVARPCPTDRASIVMYKNQTYCPGINGFGTIKIGFNQQFYDSEAYYDFAHILDNLQIIAVPNEDCSYGTTITSNDVTSDCYLNTESDYLFEVYATKDCPFYFQVSFGEPSKLGQRMFVEVNGYDVDIDYWELDSETMVWRKIGTYPYAGNWLDSSCEDVGLGGPYSGSNYRINLSEGDRVRFRFEFQENPGSCSNMITGYNDYHDGYNNSLWMISFDRWMKVGDVDPLGACSILSYES